MADAEERKEYVMNDTGRVYVGTRKQISGRPWNFGQVRTGPFTVWYNNNYIPKYEMKLFIHSQTSSAVHCVWEWISYFNPHFIMDVIIAIIYPCRGLKFSRSPGFCKFFEWCYGPKWMIFLVYGVNLLKPKYSGKYRTIICLLMLWLIASQCQQPPWVSLYWVKRSFSSKRNFSSRNHQTYQIYFLLHKNEKTSITPCLGIIQFGVPVGFF